LAAYIHGNLAIEQKSTTIKEKAREFRRVPQQRTLPIQEKLLYLFTVAVCVAVACVVVWRYAQIYEMSSQIHTIQQRIDKLESENSALKQEVGKLQSPQRLIDVANMLGMQPVEDKQISRIPAKSSHDTGNQRVAMKP
jgi:cell division protein FtsL